MNGIINNYLKGRGVFVQRKQTFSFDWFYVVSVKAVPVEDADAKGCLDSPTRIHPTVWSYKNLFDDVERHWIPKGWG